MSQEVRSRQGAGQGEQGSLTVLAVYSWPEFWSMGEGRGAPSFFLSITSFPRRGHKLHVLMPGPPGTPTEEDYHGVTLHRFHTSVDFMPGVGRSRVLQHVRMFFSYLYWFVRSVPVARALAAKLRPDVVIGMGELGVPVSRRIAVELGVPNVTRLFGQGLTEVVGNRFKFALRYREKRAFTTPADYIILHDDGSGGDEIARGLGVDMRKLLYLPNGVNKALYESREAETDVKAELGLDPDDRIVLSVARLHPEKHIERLIAAIPGVLREREDVKFVIVGSGGEHDALAALADSLGVGCHVVFAGSFDQKKLVDYYKSADLFVAVSDRTNLSNPVTEAMMSRLPVIALNTGATGGFIHDGDNGVLLERDDLPRLHEVILSLLADEKKARALGERGRETADAWLPTFEERQDTEAGVAERAVMERRSGKTSAGQ